MLGVLLMMTDCTWLDSVGVEKCDPLTYYFVSRRSGWRLPHVHKRSVWSSQKVPNSPPIHYTLPCSSNETYHSHTWSYLSWPMNGPSLMEAIMYEVLLKHLKQLLTVITLLFPQASPPAINPSPAILPNAPTDRYGVNAVAKQCACAYCTGSTSNGPPTWYTMDHRNWNRRPPGVSTVSL